MRIVGLDHIVLTVASIEHACTFYEGALGMTREIFADGRVALKFADQKINLHLKGKEFEPKARQPTPGSADLCLIVESVAEAKDALHRAGVAIEHGPVDKVGARGALLSIYCRDPDGNLVELAEYR